MEDLWKQVSITSFTSGLLLYIFMGNVKNEMRVEVLTVVLLLIQVFWYVALCSWRIVVCSYSGSHSSRRLLLDPEDEGCMNL
jgi:hypothetical protein